MIPILIVLGLTFLYLVMKLLDKMDNEKDVYTLVPLSFWICFHGYVLFNYAYEVALWLINRR